MQTVPDLDAIDIKMDENASIETIRPNSPLFDSARVTFNDSVEMIQAQEAVDDHEDQNLKKGNCYPTKICKRVEVEATQIENNALYNRERLWKLPLRHTLPKIRKL